MPPDRIRDEYGRFVAARCDYCDEGASSLQQYWNMNTGLYQNACTDCEAMQIFCDSCGDSTLNGLHIVEENLCQACFRAAQLEDDDTEEQCGEIHGYSYKPSARFHATDGEIIGRRGVVRYNDGVRLVPVPTFGIELETECVGVSNRTLAQLWGECSNEEEDFYLKYDGSLNDGIEVVTHPRTLSSWREFCKDDFAETLYAMSQEGARAWNTTTAGLHVHVGRNAFQSTAHLARFGLLINRNRGDAVRFAQRTSSYAMFSSVGRRYSETISKAKDWYLAGHFDAVNMGGNDGTTVEVRIFKPSLAVARILAAIEFVAAGVEYTRDMTSGETMHGSLTFSRFATYLANNGYECARLANEGQRFSVSNSLEISKSKFGAQTAREDYYTCA